jgi:CubicO group peptidase (beta-lactamase class C family)
MSHALGFSPRHLQRIDRFLTERYIDPGRLAGAQVTVFRRGHLAHQATLGLADAERGRRLEEDAIFRIYSMTKPIVSLAFMMLVEEGKVALDDPVARYIPAWKDQGVFVAGSQDAGWMTRPPAQPMRIVDLLRHTSGLTYGFQQRTNIDQAYRRLHMENFDREGGLDGMIADLAKVPLQFDPGSHWNYSVSTDVVGYLVGKLSDRPLDEVLKDRIFDPLGMVDTGFHVPAEQAHRLGACYELRAGNRALQDDPQTSPFLKAPSLISGGGGLVSTSADYLRFARMLLGKGALDGERLVSPKTLALMTANHLPGGQDMTQASISLFSEAAYAGVGFGLGFAVTLDPAKTLIPGSPGEFFWGGMASTFFWVDPLEDLTCVLMTQLMPSSSYPIRREIRTLVYSALSESNV